jgi:hypothetical protein
MRSKYVILFTVLITFCSTVFSQKKVDKLAPLRTAKKIISVSSVSNTDDYAIQIIALEHPAEEPAFFNNVDEAREFSCNDGYMRYCVGNFNSYGEAKSKVSYYKQLGYTQAFVVNTKDYSLKGKKYGGFKPDPNKTYTIQLSAFRFPVFLSHFKGVDNVMEFYLKDKVFRYTVGKYKYNTAVNELPSIKALGYKDAFVTELDVYLPYQIE